MTRPWPAAACPGQRTIWAEISISKTKHLPPQALSGANSYKASGCVGCNVATLIFRLGHLSVRDTVELSLRCFLTVSQQWSGLFEHGSVRRDRAHAVCTATRLVAVWDAMWRPSSSGWVTFLLSVRDTVELSL